MRIDIFCEHYPSPVKPYFDCQFEQFLAAGHTLRIFALGRHRGAIDPKVAALGLDAMVRYAPATLGGLPSIAGQVASQAVRHPLLTVGRAVSAARHAAGLKAAVLNAGRAAMLPADPPDLCFVHALTAAVHFGFVRRIHRGVPVAFYYHGGEVAGVRPISDAEARRAFLSADVVFTNTENSRQHAIGRGCPPERILVSPVGFSLSEFRPAARRPYRAGGVFNVLSIGRLSDEKGFAHAIDAVAALKARRVGPFRYRLIGGGPLERDLRARVTELGLDDTVEFLGQVGRDALYDALTTADALVLPSVVWGTWQENQACVLQEAMLMKTPAIGTRTGGVPESVSPELTPYLVPPGDAVALADSLQRMMALPEAALADLGDRSRAFAERTYDIVRLNQQVLEAIASRTSTHPPSRS